MEPIDRLTQKLIIEYMGSDEARDILVDRKRPDVAALRERERIILGKIDQLAVDNLEELLTKRQVKIQTDHLQAQLDEIAKGLRRSAGSKALADLVDNPALWGGYSLDRRRMVIGEVVEFTLESGGKGRVFKPEHLRHRWLLEE